MKPVRQAVIDIGSNTIRLVVYAGLPRAPMPIYNEKSRVALGACLADDGIIDGTQLAHQDLRRTRLSAGSSSAVQPGGTQVVAV